MVLNQEDRRICTFCSKEFYLTRSQKRQAKEKWATNCSRSCARKAQHLRNHSDKRTKKECIACKKPFIVTNWDKDKTCCSNQCAASVRFGLKNREHTRERLERILRDEKFKKYLDGVLHRLAARFKLSEDFIEDARQEYYLSLWDGCNTKIENVVYSGMRKEIKKGITGEWQSTFTIGPMECLELLKSQKKNLDGPEFREFVFDMMKGLSEREVKFLSLYLIGFKDHELMEEIRKKFPISNHDFYREKETIRKKIDGYLL